MMISRTDLSALIASLSISLVTLAGWPQAANATTIRSELPPQIQTAEARSDLGMVSTGSLEATEAAVAVLESGGNAIDAAVVASLVLSVADPRRGGLAAGPRAVSSDPADP